MKTSPEATGKTGMSISPAIGRSIQARYAAEANTSASLSCGRALDLSGIAPHEVVLDLGCGRGRDALRAARMSRFAWGVDITPAMVEAARESAAKEGVLNAEFREGSLEQTGLPAESVDVVISNCALNHAPDKSRVFTEIARVLKGGGRFVVSDIIAEETIPEDISSDPAAVAGCYGGAVTRQVYFGAIAAAAGFSLVEILEESLPYEKNGVWLRSLTLRSVKNTPPAARTSL